MRQERREEEKGRMGSFLWREDLEGLGDTSFTSMLAVSWQQRAERGLPTGLEKKGNLFSSSFLTPSIKSPPTT